MLPSNSKKGPSIKLNFSTSELKLLLAEIIVSTIGVRKRPINRERRKRGKTRITKAMNMIYAPS